MHILPAEDMLGLREPRETIEVSRKPTAPDDIELDLVTHDIRKFMLLMLKKNGYVLEQLYSPLVVHTTPEHEELKALGKGCITRHHNHHYLGFARTQWGLFAKEDPPKVKPLLYVYRVLLTGIYLMRSGVVEANLLKLNTRDLCGEGFPLPYIDDLVARKVEGGERLPPDGRGSRLPRKRDYLRLTTALEEAGQSRHVAGGAHGQGRDERSASEGAKGQGGSACPVVTTRHAGISATQSVSMRRMPRERG